MPKINKQAVDIAVALFSSTTGCSPQELVEYRNVLIWRAKKGLDRDLIHMSL